MSYLGAYSQGRVVWVPAIATHPLTGQEFDPTFCGGYYQRMTGAPGAGTALVFNQFNTETGAWYAVIDTAPLAPGMYQVLVEATVAGVESNAWHVFEVIPAATTYSPTSPATGECLTVEELQAQIDTGEYSASVIQGVIDRIAGKLYSRLGHTFGRAFRLAHDMSADDATFEVTADALVLTLVGGLHAGDHTFSFTEYPQTGQLVDAINAAAIGFTAELLEVIPYEQPSANLRLSHGNVFGIRHALQYGQWTECFSGNNEHCLFTSMTIRTTVSVIEDGRALSAGSDYYIKDSWLVRMGCVGHCFQAGYWSCYAPCNVCVTYIPRWFGLCPAAFINALVLLAQYEIEGMLDGTYQSERMGDYSYTKGKAADAWHMALSGLGPYFVKVVL